jgi:hypothetical protein
MKLPKIFFGGFYILTEGLEIKSKDIRTD